MHDASFPPPTKRNKRAVPRQATSDVAWELTNIDIPDDDPLLDFEPVPHSRPRRNSITPDLQRAFIAHLAATGIVKSAAAHIGKSLEAIYKLRQRPGAQGFCEAWDEALRWGVLRLEDCAIERALAEGLSNLRANSMLAWVLQYRGFMRVEAHDVIPGHWLYESIKEKVLREERERRRRKAEPST
ncbi:hypothetical protein ABIE62_000295 [Porphyrobacter sp. MBR-155]|jgi:hypothetical protein|uniref:hypothetical protein n=1 Tax=Porphyrobacter sp. MBR-155 TaxID=3156464 RepID=UPI003398B942